MSKDIVDIEKLEVVAKSATVGLRRNLISRNLQLCRISPC